MCNPKHTMALIHGAATDFPEILNYLAENYPSLVVKTGVFKTNSNVETTTMAKYREEVCNFHSINCLRNLCRQKRENHI
jgi:hypothetical protein